MTLSDYEFKACKYAAETAFRAKAPDDVVCRLTSYTGVANLPSLCLEWAWQDLRGYKHRSRRYISCHYVGSHLSYLDMIDIMRLEATMMAEQAAQTKRLWLEEYHFGTSNR